MKGNCLKGCFCSKAGFTLIELLVVVLIIGILAAVAVPQYQKAVEKSRATQALAMLASAYEHAAVYYMATGAYPATFDEMGMDVPWPVTTESALKWARTGYETETHSDGTWSLQLYHAGTGQLIIFIGRVSGKYAGGGFEVEVVNTTGQLNPKNIRCAERAVYGTLFEGEDGDYCEKIMHATFLPGVASTYRPYALP